MSSSTPQEPEIVPGTSRPIPVDPVIQPGGVPGSDPQTEPQIEPDRI